MKVEFSIPITSSEISFATGAVYKGEKRTFTHLTTSSNDADENTIFVALQGKHTTGEDYVHALQLKKICSLSTRKGDFLFSHSSPLHALLQLARYYKTKLKNLKHTIAITGSVGKTTTKEYLYRILSKRYKTHANEGNLNSEIGVPLTIFQTPRDCETLILEFGMNHMGEIQKLASCASPDYGIITNIGHAHIGNLGTRENIAREKMKICFHNENLPVLIMGKEPLLNPLRNKIQVLSDFSITENNGVTLLSHRQDESHPLEIKSLPSDKKECLLLSCAMGMLLGLSNEELTEGIVSCYSYAGRRKIIQLGAFRLIDDTYNASPESVISAITFLQEIHAQRKFIVLGDMMELGEHTQRLHSEIGKKLSELSLDAVFLIGEFGHYTRGGLIENGYDENCIFLYEDSQNYEGIIRKLSDMLRDGDVCLLKGSNGTKMWRVTEGLEEVFEK